MDRSPLSGIDANLLVALDALLAEQHVGRAARRLGLSESAMSHALARARRAFDDPLLVRVGRRMTLTDQGRRMAPKLRDGIARLSAAVESPRELDLASVRRTVRIAATDFVHSVIGVPLWREVETRAPGVELFFTGVTSDSARALTDGDLDLLVASPRTAKGLHEELLLRDGFVSMVRDGHPALEKRMTAARFAALDHVVVTPSPRGRGAVDRALATKKLRRRVAYVSPTFMGAARLVAASDLVLTGSAHNAREIAPWLKLAVFAPPVVLTPFSQVMFWHARHHDDPFLAWLRDAVRRAADRGIAPSDD